jgi:hypothetical protein
MQINREVGVDMDRMNETDKLENSGKIIPFTDFQKLKEEVEKFRAAAGNDEPAGDSTWRMSTKS